MLLFQALNGNDHRDVEQVTQSLPESATIEPSPAAGTTSSTLHGARAVWATVRAAFGSVLGLTPHVLHHVGIIAGTALLAGTWGNLLLYAVGLLLSIPLLKRLRRRFGSPVAPILGVAIFTAMFLFSALVLGPAINPSQPGPAAPTPVSPSDPDGHAAHHR
jgi:hypothetical protein